MGKKMSNYVCDKCPKVFETERGFRIHRGLKHPHYDGEVDAEFVLPVKNAIPPIIEYTGIGEETDIVKLTEMYKEASKTIGLVRVRISELMEMVIMEMVKEVA